MKFDDLISTIDALSDDDIDDIVDWQMTQSPAAKQQHGGGLQAAGHRGYGIGLTPSAMQNPLQRLTNAVQNMLDSMLTIMYPGMEIDIATWFPDEMLHEMLPDRCTQCARHLPESQRNPSRLCDECARMRR